MDSYQETFAVWDKVATKYQDKFMNIDIYNNSYDIFCRKIGKEQANIFEIGCGPGNITKYLLEKCSSFSVDAIDTSYNMIELAKANNPKANFTVMDCRQIDSITTKYDGVIGGFCLPYLSKKDCQKLIKDSAKLLTTNGVFYISSIEGKYEQSGYEVGSTGDRMFVHYYEAEFLFACLEKNNFFEIETMRIGYPKNDGSINTHLVFIARKQ